MAASQAAYVVEKAVGHDDNATIPQDVTNFAKTDPDEETMKALVWQGKNKVEIGTALTATVLAPSQSAVG